MEVRDTSIFPLYRTNMLAAAGREEHLRRQYICSRCNAGLRPGSPALCSCLLFVVVVVAPLLLLKHQSLLKAAAAPVADHFAGEAAEAIPVGSPRWGDYRQLLLLLLLLLLLDAETTTTTCVQDIVRMHNCQGSDTAAA